MAHTLPPVKEDTPLSISHHIHSIGYQLNHAKEHIHPGTTTRLDGLKKLKPTVAKQQAARVLASIDKMSKKIKPYVAIKTTGGLVDKLPSIKGAKR